MKYKIALHSDVGIQKETNQDSLCVKQAQTHKGTVTFAVVCDGMGGLEKGEVASATLIKKLAKWFDVELTQALKMTKPVEEIQYRWNRIIKEQSQEIAVYGRSNHIQLGTTVTMMLILENGEYIIGNVGDSRIYKITNDNINLLTKDQTLVAHEIEMGRLTPEEAEKDDRRSVLLQCVGASKTVIPDFFYGRANKDECYFLCSDGFRHEITSDEIMQAFYPMKNNEESEMENNIIKMIEINKARQETDNISGILIKVE